MYHIKKILNLKSNRLFTQALRASDAKKLFEFYSEKEAMKFRGSKPMETIDDAHEMINNQAYESNEATYHRTGLRLIDNNHLIGTLLLKFKNDKSVEIGFSYGQSYWNQGFASETCDMLESYFQQDNKIEKITAWCKKENFACGRMATIYRNRNHISKRNRSLA